MFNEKGDLTTVLNKYYHDGEITDLWYDWFCTERSLPKRGKRLMQILAYFVKYEKLDKRGKYAFFKNNAPMSGGTYDQVSICENETGKVLYCIQEKKAGEVMVYTVFDEFDKPRLLPI